MHVIVFDQTNARPRTLGPAVILSDVLNLGFALREPFERRQPAQLPEVDFYTVEDRCVPEPTRLEWNASLSGETLLEQAVALQALADGHVVQAFVFNGDGDCIRHFLLVPAGEPTVWMP